MIPILCVFFNKRNIVKDDKVLLEVYVFTLFTFFWVHFLNPQICRVTAGEKYQ